MTQTTSTNRSAPFHVIYVFLVLLTLASSHASATEDERNNIQVFKQASPAVVYVTNNTVVRNRYSFDLQTVAQGSGTGFVWDKKGHIVTNFHVVEEARQINITLQDQTTWPAKVVGLAPDRDLVVLKIDAPPEKLTPLVKGDSSYLTVGNKVLAIGNPFGLDTTLTVGVISALGREIQAPNNRKIRNVIQTDAAINPGNSGGPLLNSAGELIGVNTAIYSPSGTSVGIGFAIPINTVKKTIPELIENGRLVRPVLGIEVAPEHWAQRNGIKGVPVLRASPGGPARAAGLKGITRNQWGATVLGDIIIGIDDQVIETYDDLLTALETHKPGDRVELNFVRDGRIQTTKLVLTAPTN